MLAVLKEVYNPDTPNGDLPMGRQTYFIPNALLEEADVGAQGMDAYRWDIALQTFITSRMGYCCSNNILDAIHHRIGGDGPNFIEAASLLVAKSCDNRTIFTSIDRGCTDNNTTFFTYRTSMELVAKQSIKMLPVIMSSKYGDSCKPWFDDIFWERAHKAYSINPSTGAITDRKSVV